MLVVGQWRLEVSPGSTGEQVIEGADPLAIVSIATTRYPYILRIDSLDGQQGSALRQRWIYPGSAIGDIVGVDPEPLSVSVENYGNLRLRLTLPAAATSPETYQISVWRAPQPGAQVAMSDLGIALANRWILAGQTIWGGMWHRPSTWRRRGHLSVFNGGSLSLSILYRTLYVSSASWRLDDQIIAQTSAVRYYTDFPLLGVGVFGVRNDSPIPGEVSVYVMLV